MSIESIVGRISTYKCRLVEVTGGEPLIQDETPRLIRELLDSGYEVIMETNGTLNIALADRRCTRIMDIKCPDSGEESRNDLRNLDRLTPRDQIKFVIGTREDYIYARDMIGRLPKVLPSHHVLLSPVTGKLMSARLSEWMLADHLEARLHLQLHKIVWPDIDRGI